MYCDGTITPENSAFFPNCEIKGKVLACTFSTPKREATGSNPVWRAKKPRKQALFGASLFKGFTTQVQFLLHKSVPKVKQNERYRKRHVGIDIYPQRGASGTTHACQRTKCMQDTVCRLHKSAASENSGSRTLSYRFQKEHLS